MRHADRATPLLVIARRLGLPIGSLLRARDDVRRNTWHSGLCLTGMYALLGAAIAGLVPHWALLVCIPPLYLRSALSVHELMHARSERQVPWLHRLMMVLESPVSLGYREHRDIHVRHHRHCVTDADPELYQIRGGHVRALGAALLSPEWAFVTYVRERGVSRALAAEAAVRGVAFAAVSIAGTGAFLYYWVALRASVGLSSYAFHHVLHQKNGVYGTYALELSPVVQGALGVLIGRECVHVLTEHPAHHAWQGVKAERLPAVAPALAAAGPETAAPPEAVVAAARTGVLP